MRDFRRNGDAAVGSGAGAGAPTPGKRTLVEATRFGTATAVAQQGDPATTPLGDPFAAQADPIITTLGDPNAPQQGDPTGPGTLLDNTHGAVQNGPGKPTVTLSMPESMATPLTFNATDYRDLYGQVSARVGKEAGSVTTQLSDDVKTLDDNVTSVAFTAPLKTMLPDWPQKGTQPAADQAKFDAWKGSVATHEGQHRQIYKTEYAKLKTAVIGPKESDVDAQSQVVVDNAEKAQDAFDASNQPAPLAAPGGIEKVKSSDASDVTAPSDTDTAVV